MSADPEKIVSSINRLDAGIGKLNKNMNKLFASVDRNVRAQTKVVAAANRSHGVMLGVVADLELMGGAFGKMKRFLNAMFSPIGNATTKGEKFVQALTSWGGAFEHILKPIGKSMAQLRTAKSTSITPGMTASRTALGGALAEGGARGVGMPFPTFRTPRPVNWSRITPSDQMMHQGFGPPAQRAGIPFGPARLPTSGSTRLLGAMGTRGPGAGIPFTGARGPAALGPTGNLSGTAGENIAKGAKSLGKLGTGAFAKGTKAFSKNVMTPIKQTMGGGIGLGFQTQIIMGLMQAFSGLFAGFQPVIDVISTLVEIVGTAFTPIITVLLETLTAPPMMNFIMQLTDALTQIMEAIAPLVPIFIMLFKIGLYPMLIFFKFLAIILKPLMPLFEWLGELLTALEPILDIIVNVALVALLWAFWAVGIGIAAVVDFVTRVIDAIDFLNLTPVRATNYVGAWDAMMNPNTLMQFAEGGIVPYTGLALVHAGEEVLTPEERGRGGNQITVNINGGIWTQDIDDFTTQLSRKLSLYAR